MSTEQATMKAKETWKGVKDLLEKAEEAAHKAYEKAAPAVQKSLDTSLDAASKGFNSTMKTIGTRTEKEQVDLLKAYRKFLAGQTEFVDSRLRALETKPAEPSS